MGNDAFIGVFIMKKLFILFLLLTTNLWAQASNSIEEVIQDYFQGYQRADVRLIKKSFHEETKLLSVYEEKMDVLEMNDWLKSLEDRHARGDIRIGSLKIESIDITKGTAMVKLRIRFEHFEFTDYLSFLNIEGSWIIVGKIFHFQGL